MGFLMGSVTAYFKKPVFKCLKISSFDINDLYLRFKG